MNHSDDFLSQSLSVPNTKLCVANLQEIFQLDFIDDDIALEAPELVVLDLSVLSSVPCSDVQLTPFNGTQIIVYDDDSEYCTHT